MGKFNAATAVEAMEYDFTAYGGSKGRIPEPSNGQVQTFFDTVRQLAKEVRSIESGSTEVTDEDAAEFLAGMSDDVVSKYEEQLATAVAELCNGTPSADEIRQLPFRVSGAFSAWLAGELRPEATRPAMKR